MELEIKLSLAYMYISLSEFELAENLSKSVARKLIDNKKEMYPHAKAFMKLLSLLMDDDHSVKDFKKIRAALDLFNLQNHGYCKILEFLQPHMEAMLAVS
jgi:hypothetical protein